MIPPAPKSVNSEQTFSPHLNLFDITKKGSTFVLPFPGGELLDLVLFTPRHSLCFFQTNCCVLLVGVALSCKPYVTLTPLGFESLFDITKKGSTFVLPFPGGDSSKLFELIVKIESVSVF